MATPSAATRRLSAVILFSMLRRQQRLAAAQGQAPAAKTEARMAVHISTVLRAGVTLATAFVLFGATLYLSRHGTTEPLYEAFTGEPEALRSVAGIWGAALSGSGRGVIQLGLLVLLATPIARVALSFVTFAAILDRTYVVAAGIVLAMLCLGLAGGPA